MKLSTARFRAIAVVGFAVAAGTAALAAPSQAAPAGALGVTRTTGTIYLVQGVDKTTMRLEVDGKVVAAAARSSQIVGPLSLPAGRHTLSASAPGRTAVTASINVAAGSNADAVLHRTVDPAKPPVVTVYPNDLSPVQPGSSRLVVAHTAAVGPADVRVKGKVLFSNIANGEALTLTVPAGSYPVDIVPDATSGPVVFGPVDLPVTKSSLTRVFAIGVAATHSMDAVLQVLPLQPRGSGASLRGVNAGDGGQAAVLIAAHGAAPVPHDSAEVTGMAAGAATMLAVLSVGTAFVRRRRLTTR